MSDVLIRQTGACGRVTLNRPAALNALTLEMGRAVYVALMAWRKDDTVAFVLIDGAGERGLCAGGDIRALYQCAIDGNLESAAIFFREEYRLNHLIATYPKPFVAVMDGLVMGGGVGISAHGSHRIVTERSMIAMPETGIGFLPDVGGTYLLGRAPGELGSYLALSGARIGAADAVLCGLADTYVPSDGLTGLIAELERCGTRVTLEASLAAHAMEAPAGKLRGMNAWIDRCFGLSSVEEIVRALETSEEAEAKAAASELLRNSPTSLKVTLQALRQARASSELVTALEQEYVLALALMRDGDFREGVRAAVIDKDRRPAWRPAALAEVSAQRVAELFKGAGLPQVPDDAWFA